MRIIAGEFRHRKLFTPRDAETTRPIPDRVKESLFSLLRGHFEGAQVLDCFSGTGSIGLEAISRGAAFVLFVEKDKNAAAILERNIEMLGCGDRCEVLKGDALGSAMLARCPRPLDLAFFDPPYPMIRDGAGWDRVRGQVSRVVALLADTGYACVRTPQPFMLKAAEATPAATEEPLARGRKPGRDKRRERLGRKLREQEWVLDEINVDEIESQTAADEAELIELEGDGAARTTGQPGPLRAPADLAIAGALGPETHKYGSTAVHLYMRARAAAPAA
ncbi:MAG: 16S rRNA (guanine(966)-N(2))-methyltransferase RsmD [Phycisphaeraceae bacterium]|nr:16S rRNA (guanine(966)-N(2))-methyltransferase RsmD [Phycisphaeraceae bacterium]